jgi:hypothetical protein
VIKKDVRNIFAAACIGINVDPGKGGAIAAPRKIAVLKKDLINLACRGLGPDERSIIIALAVHISDEGMR